MGWFLFYGLCAMMGIANVHDLYFYYKDFPFGSRNSFDDLQLFVLHRLHVVDVYQKYRDGILKQKIFYTWKNNCSMNND